MKKIIVILVFIIYVIGCGEKHNHDHGDHDHTEQTQTHEGEEEHHVPDQVSPDDHDHLHISDSIVEQWGIKFSLPQYRNRIAKIQLNGIVKVNENSTFFLNSLVSGIVVEINKDIGDKVKRGDTLCILNSPELLSLRTKYIKAFQEYKQSKEDYERAKQLFKIKAIEKKSLTNRETLYKSALASHFSLEAKINSICFNEKNLNQIKEAIMKDDVKRMKAFLSPFYQIPSPGNGKVLNRNLYLGEMVENNRTIFEISETKVIWVIMDALEKDLQYIKKGNMVEIQTDVYPGEVFSGKIMNIMESLDPELRTIKIRVEVDNQKELLKPYMYVKGNLEKENKGKFLAVPIRAVVKVSGLKGVFIKEGDGFAFKPIEIMDTDSTGYVFVKGLKENLRVVVQGAFYLKAEYELNRGAEQDPHAGHQH